MISTTVSTVSCVMITLLRLAVCQDEPTQDSSNQISLTKTVFKHDVMEIDFRALFPKSQGEVYFKQFSPDDYHDSDRMPVFSLKKKLQVLHTSTSNDSCLRLFRVGDSRVLSMNEDYSFSLFEVSPRSGLRTELQTWRLEGLNIGLRFLGLFRDDNNASFAYVLWCSRCTQSAPEGLEDSSAQLTVTEISLRVERTPNSVRNTTIDCGGCRTDRLRLVVDSLGLMVVMIYGHRDSSISMMMIDLESFKYVGEAHLASNILKADSFEVIVASRSLYLYTLDVLGFAVNREIAHVHKLAPLSIEQNTLSVSKSLLFELDFVKLFAEKEEFARPIFITKVTKNAEKPDRLIIAVRGRVFEVGLGNNQAISLQQVISTANSSIQHESITSLEEASDGSYLLVLESDRCLNILVIDITFGILRHSRHIDPQSLHREVQSPVLLVDGPESPNHLLVTCNVVNKYDPRDIAVGRFDQYSGKVTGSIGSTDGKILRYDIDIIDDLASIVRPDLIFNPILISSKLPKLKLQIEGNRFGIKANNLTVSLLLPQSTRSKPGVQLSFQDLSWRRLLWYKSDQFALFLKEVQDYAHFENVVIGFDGQGKGRLFLCPWLTLNSIAHRCGELEVENNFLRMSSGHLIRAFSYVLRDEIEETADLLLVTSNETATEILSFKKLKDRKVRFQNKTTDKSIRIISGEIGYNLRIDLDFIGIGQSLETGEHSIYTFKVRFTSETPVIGKLESVEITLKYPYVPFAQVKRNHREAVYLLQVSSDTEPKMVLTWFQLAPQPQTSKYIAEEVAYSVIDQEVYRAVNLCEDGLLLEDRAKQGLLLRSLISGNTEDSYLFPFPWRSTAGGMLVVTDSQYCLIVSEDQGYLYDLSTQYSHPLNRLIRSFRLDFNASENSETSALMLVSYMELQVFVCRKDGIAGKRCILYFHRVKSLIFSVEIHKPYKLKFIEVVLQSSPSDSLTSMLPVLRKYKPDVVKAHPFSPNNPIYDSQGLPITYKLSSLLAVHSEIMSYEIEHLEAGIIELTNAVTQLPTAEAQTYLDQFLPATIKPTQASFYSSNRLQAAIEDGTVTISNTKKEVIHSIVLRLEDCKDPPIFELRELSDVIMLIVKYRQSDLMYTWRFYIMGYSSGSKLSSASLDTRMTTTKDLESVLEDTTKRKLLIFGQGELRKGRRYIVFSLVRVTATSSSLPTDSGFSLSFHPDVFVFELGFIFQKRNYRHSTNMLVNIIFGSHTNQIVYLKLTVDLDDLKIAAQSSVSPFKDFLISSSMPTVSCRTDNPVLSFVCLIKTRSNRAQRVEVVFSMDGDNELTIFDTNSFVLPEGYEIRRFYRGSHNTLIQATKGRRMFCFVFDRSSSQLIHALELTEEHNPDELLKEIDSQLYIIGFNLKNGAASGLVFRKATAKLKFTQQPIRQEVLFNSYLKLTDANGKVKSIPLAHLFAADNAVPSWMIYLAASILVLGLLSAILLWRYNLKNYSMHLSIPDPIANNLRIPES